MKITYANGSIPEPLNENLSAPVFELHETVFVNGIGGKIVRIAFDKSWMDIRFFYGRSERLHWHRAKKEYFITEDIAPVKG